ncbi:DUF2269 family protein [Legionella londiniensis]|uniref:Integral membrane protein n=2 Tax=Legionella londiniensis TaxID=45068 RepID=A0A0W0VS89_9GAMM|nr:DUF2269 domain-containing protein [Legionella londiniensis]KTD22534.1 integral membrane protein [Legionella londiniensis]STX92465.1 integral membrane protein [Legionella londiniensis]
MTAYFIVKVIHIISSTILFGSGLAIAFFMFCSKFSANLHEKYFAARYTVTADLVFTLPAVIIQPLTGFWMVWYAGYSWSASWLMLTYILYIIAGACWLPVVWLQIELKRILKLCIEQNYKLPGRYHQLFNLWFMLGWPAFLSLLVIFYLMVNKPS